MRKIIMLKNGGAVIDISPLEDVDFAIIYHNRECLILENRLDEECQVYYNPDIDKQPEASREIKTSSKKPSKRIKAKTVSTK
jgi:hypothetical protein